jgi:hypothetical protein
VRARISAAPIQGVDARRQFPPIATILKPAGATGAVELPVFWMIVKTCVPMAIAPTLDVEPVCA